MAQPSARAAPHASNDARKAAPAAIELRGLRRVYSAARGSPARLALDGVSLTIAAGQRVALLGPNGSGKSTLLRILATIDLPDEGCVSLLGQDVGGAKGAAAIRAELGVVFQSPALDGLLTVRENLAAHAALYGLERRDAGARIDDAARRAGLSDRLKDRVGVLSGGLVRRVDLARATLHGPRLLLLDEPTTGLDQRARGEFLDALDHMTRGTTAGAPVTVVLATHLMDEAERAERVVMLDRGRVVADAPPAELRARAGGAVLRIAAPVDDALAAELSGAGMSGPPPSAGVGRPGVFALPDDGGEAASRAARILTGCGVPFEIGPPTLADAYLGLTGRELSPRAIYDGDGACFSEQKHATPDGGEATALETAP